jgi:hypothetical protein
LNVPWTDAVVGLLLDDTVAFVRRFVALTSEQADAVALWVFHTHAFAAAEATPYLAITSAEKRSGKTRLLEILELLVPRPWLTGSATAATLSRKIHADKPTLLLDESDAAFKGDKDYAEALRAILNTGYRRGGKRSVCVMHGSDAAFVDLETFCPKAIAGIGSLPDTVADRSIPIRLQRKSRSEVVERFRRRKVEPEATGIRDRIASWAEPNVEFLRGLEPPLPDELDDRAQDVWEPLLAIADAAGDDWARRARGAAVELSGANAKQEDSFGVRLLSDIRTVFAQSGGLDRLRSSDLIWELAKIPEAPWGEWYGKTITAQSIAKLLRPYGIRTQEIWVSGKKERGYLRSQFAEFWDRYLPEEPVDVVGVVDAGAAPEAAPTTPTTPTSLSQDAANGAPCRYPSHRESDWINEQGQPVCGICHPKPGTPRD